MLNKSEKKYYAIKILACLIVIFFVVMAFINPKPTVEHIEKPFTLSDHAQ